VSDIEESRTAVGRTQARCAEDADAGAARLLLDCRQEGEERLLAEPRVLHET
jgi:hypothetical protein